MINRYGISKDEKFTPEFQDKLAYILLQEIWLNDFSNWIISKTDFQFRLSKKWASIAKDDSWLSYYHWDSMNNHASKAGKSVGVVLDKLYA
jgi:muramidase (phage lysozyme)